MQSIEEFISGALIDAVKAYSALNE